MTRRWLSRRGRHQNTTSLGYTTSGNSNHDFDFAFSKDSPVSLSTALPSLGPKSERTLQDERATTSSGIGESRTRKKLRIDVPQLRPQTAESHRVSTFGFTHRHAASRSQDDLIGVAFGSPSHPPVNFRALAAQMSPKAPDHAFGHQGPFPEKQRRLQPKAWKKIGALFKVRHAVTKATESSAESSPIISQQQEASKSEESLPKHHWFKHKTQVPEQPTRYPPPIPLEEETFKDRSNRRKSSSEGKTMLFDPTPLSSPNIIEETRKSVEHPAPLPSLPKLEINIPNPPLDRYTVMFQNMPAASTSSSLLARRSKTLDSLKSSTDGSRNNSQLESEGKAIALKIVDEAGGELLPARRMTDPRLPKPEFALKTSTSSPAVSKYSLFPPASPAPIKIIGRIQHESPLKRSATSPARLSPMQAIFLSEKPKPLGAARKLSTAQEIVSPEAHTASTDVTEPWSTTHSIKSSVSSSTTMDEIFFDIRSVRDSKGLEDGQHFVMARPDSTVVQIARTRSKLNGNSRSRQKRPQASTAPMFSKPILPVVQADKHFSVSSVNTAIFDEAIAAVEELTSSHATREQSAEAGTGLVNTPENVPPPRANTSRQSSATRVDLSLKLLPPDPILPGRTQNQGKSKMDQIDRVLPSPIFEEVSPLSMKGMLSEKPSANSARPRDPSPIHQPNLTQVTQATPKSLGPNSTPPRKPVPTTTAPQPPPQPAKPITVTAKSPCMRILARTDHPIEESPTIPQGPPPRPYSPSAALALSADLPPPVPKKDAKFIPISKFAAKNTVSKAQKSGVRPAPPERSATDTIVIDSRKAGQKPTGLRKAERSATIPAPGSVVGARSRIVQVQARPSPQMSSASGFASTPRDSPGVQQGEAQTVAAVAQPADAAEVSIARTVSLSRKQSARVQVPGPKLAARRAHAAEDEERKGKEHGPDSASTSARATPVLVTISSPKEQDQTRQDGKSSVDLSATARTPTPDIKAKLNPLTSHPMDSQISLLSQHSQQSYTSEISTMSKAQEKVDKELIEKFKEKDKSKWEVIDAKGALSPMVVEGQRGHKPGMSVGVVLENV